MTKEISRYTTVLKVKKHQEKVTQQQLKQIQEEHQQQQDRLDVLHNKRDDAVKGTHNFGRAKATDIQVQRAFLFKLSRQIYQQSAKVDEIREEEEIKRQELTRKAQSRQMVEKLDEKKKAEAARQADRVEQELIDDLAGRPSKVTEES
ncbi:MAG: flagellar export protein FliJ [Ignavibacteriae bacterium]|nr:flagellar export protein FliJ [Ignavibacteriota bacterium]